MGNTTDWNMPEDSRKGAMEYPYARTYRTPSGNGWTIDDTKDKESMTFFHRSGSLIQFKEDGSIVIINKKDAYNVTFGDNNMMVTGGYNITVNGGATMKVEGDYDMTVNGNAKQTIKGNMETIVNGDMSTAVKGSNEIAVAGDMTTQVKGTMQAAAKNTTLGAQSNMKIQALGTAKVIAETLDMDATTSTLDATTISITGGTLNLGDGTVNIDGSTVNIDGSPVKINGVTQVGD